MNFKLRDIKIINSVYFWAIVFVALSYAFQVQYDTWRRYGEAKISVDYNVYIEPQPLSAEAAKIVSLNSSEFMADWYWLAAIQYYGGGTPYGKYRKLAELFHTVTDLAPKFTAAYRSGLIILPGEGFVDEALLLGEKGKKNNPDSWEVPYYTGLVHHIYRKDYIAAAREFEHAAALPGALPITKYMAGIYYNQAEKRETAYAIFKVVYETSEEGFIKSRAEKYLIHLEGIFVLEQGIRIFQERFGRLPLSLNELLQKGVLSELPTSPLDLRYDYDASSGAVTDENRLK